MNTYNFELDFSRIKDLRAKNNVSQNTIATYLDINQLPILNLS